MVQYGDNHTYKTTWCNQCLEYQRNLLRASDVAATALTGLQTLRTELQREELGMLISSHVEPF